MFSLVFLDRTQVYSSEIKAQREAARYVIKHLLGNDNPEFQQGSCACDEIPTQHRIWERTKFLESFQQENYAECVSIWNNYKGSGFWVIPRDVIRIQPVVSDGEFNVSSYL